MAETYVLQTLERLRGHQLTYVDARRVWCLFGATSLTLVTCSRANRSFRVPQTGFHESLGLLGASARIGLEISRENFRQKLD